MYKNKTVPAKPERFHIIIPKFFTIKLNQICPDSSLYSRRQQNLLQI
jgi:hypothetical protein